MHQMLASLQLLQGRCFLLQVLLNYGYDMFLKGLHHTVSAGIFKKAQPYVVNACNGLKAENQVRNAYVFQINLAD